MAVNLSPVGGVAAQFFTNSGTPLTGGKIFTYAAGTTTPQTAYTTSQGNIAWTNPIVLDAAGRVPSGGEIWITDGLIYKFVLKDANDVLIATYDNITGINSNAVAYTNQQEIVTATAGQTVFNLGINYQPGTNSLSVFVDGVNQYGPGAQYSYVETDSNTVTFNAGLHVGAEVKFTTTQQQAAGAVDAAQVSYDPPFTGSVATNVEAKLAQTVSVKDFGAVGDGVTDDTLAFQDAIDYALQSGAVIFIPTGTYRVTQTLNIQYISGNVNSGTFKMYGQFGGTAYRPKSVVLFDSVGGVLFDVLVDGVDSDAFVFQDFAVTQGAFGSPSYQTAIAFQFTKTTGLYSHRFEFIGMNGSYFDTWVRFIGGASGGPTANDNYFGPVNFERFNTWALKTGIELSNCYLNLFTMRRGLIHDCSTNGGINFRGTGGSGYILDIQDVHFEGCQPAAILTSTLTSSIALNNVSAENTGTASGYGLIDGGTAKSFTRFHFSNDMYPRAFMPQVIRLPRGARVSSTTPIYVAGDGVEILTTDTIIPAVADIDDYGFFLCPLSPEQKSFAGRKIYASLAGANTNSGASPDSATLPDALQVDFIGGTKIIDNIDTSYTAPANGYIFVSWAADVTDASNNGFAVSDVTIDGTNVAPPTGFRIEPYNGVYTLVFKIESGQVLSRVRFSQYSGFWTTPAMVSFAPDLGYANKVMCGFPRVTRQVFSLPDAATTTIDNLLEFNKPFSGKVRFVFDNGQAGVFEFLARGDGLNTGRTVTTLTSSLGAGLTITDTAVPLNGMMYSKEIANATGAAVELIVETEYLN